MFVVDASVLVTHLAGTEHADQAGASLAEGKRRGGLWAPHLIDVEVGHSLRRRVTAGQLLADNGRDALRDLIRLPLRRARHRELLDRAWELRDNVSFYDGVYIALAERLELPLLTFDTRLAGAHGIRAEVEVLGQAA